MSRSTYGDDWEDFGDGPEYIEPPLYPAGQLQRLDDAALERDGHSPFLMTGLSSVKRRKTPS